MRSLIELPRYSKFLRVIQLWAYDLASALSFSKASPTYFANAIIFSSCSLRPTSCTLTNAPS